MNKKEELKRVQQMEKVFNWVSIFGIIVCVALVAYLFGYLRGGELVLNLCAQALAGAP